jgi:hypothetical protein
MRRGWAGAAAVAVAAAALAVVMTWPMAPRIDRVGRINTGDGLFSLWVVNWVARTLVTDPANLYDGNIFYPEKNTLAFSEANIVPGAAAIPFYWATKNPFVTHNAVVLLSFALAFVGAFRLVVHLSGSTAGAWAAGVAYAYCPFIFARTAHLQLLMHWGMPFCLLAFHRIVDRPGLARGVVLGLLLFLQALSCAYYGVFSGLLVGLGTLYYAWTRGLWRSSRYWVSVAVAAAVALGATVPFFIPFLEVQRGAGFSRSLEDAAMYSANWQAWLTSAAWAHRWLLPWLENSTEVLFPGLLTILVGAAGLVLALRGRAATPAVPARETAGFYAMFGVLALWGSFGPAAGLYTVLFNTLPVFSFLRAPARFGILVVITLAVGIGFAMAWVAARWPSRARVAGAALAVAMVAELATMPLPLPEAAPVNNAYRMLATLRPGPVVELPFFYNRLDFSRHAEYMLYSTYHWQPLVNGYSDHISQEFRDMVIPMSSFPTRESFGILERKRARYAVFHLNYYDRRSRARLLERIERYQQFLAPLSREGDVWLYEIVGWPR